MTATPNAARAALARPGGLNLDPFARVAIRFGRSPSRSR